MSLGLLFKFILTIIWHYSLCLSFVNRINDKGVNESNTEDIVKSLIEEDIEG